MTDIFTLPRDGQRPVRFQGTLLAEAPGRWANGREHNRYYDIAVYETEDGRFVAAWAYISCWQGEAAHHRVEVGSSLAYVITELEHFDPTEWVEGYKRIIANHAGYNEPGAPSGYYERQQALERSIRERYAAQVTDLCAALGESHDLVEEL